jgi:hypothetical protein
MSKEYRVECTAMPRYNLLGDYPWNLWSETFDSMDTATTAINVHKTAYIARFHNNPSHILIYRVIHV